RPDLEAGTLPEIVTLTRSERYWNMDWQQFLLSNWEVKLVSAVLIFAAYIDGKQLKVPNWITFPMVFSGLAYHSIANGWTGCSASLMGIGCGLLCLLPLYSIGGMGAGDVKLMA